MKLIENVGFTGTLNIRVFGPDNQTKQEIDITNLVTDSGKKLIADRLGGGLKAPVGHMALGSGTVAAAAGNTSLGAQLGRVALTNSTINNNSVVYTTVFGPGVATGAVTEAGLFNDPAAGDMLARTVFAVVNKGPDDGMSITWTVTAA